MFSINWTLLAAVLFYNFATSFSEEVPLGRTFVTRVNVTETYQADYHFLSKDNHINRIIKLERDAVGNGTCYADARFKGCEKIFSLRHVGEKMVLIEIKATTKSMAGSYLLYAYCKGTNSHCNTNPLKQFVLDIEDVPKPTSPTPLTNLTRVRPTQPATMSSQTTVVANQGFKLGISALPSLFLAVLLSLMSVF